MDLDRNFANWLFISYKFRDNNPPEVRPVTLHGWSTIYVADVKNSSTGCEVIIYTFPASEDELETIIRSGVDGLKLTIYFYYEQYSRLNTVINNLTRLMLKPSNEDLSSVINERTIKAKICKRTSTHITPTEITELSIFRVSPSEIDNILLEEQLNLLQTTLYEKPPLRREISVNKEKDMVWYRLIADAVTIDSSKDATSAFGTFYEIDIKDGKVEHPTHLIILDQNQQIIGITNKHKVKEYVESLVVSQPQKKVSSCMFYRGQVLELPSNLTEKEAHSFVKERWEEFEEVGAAFIIDSNTREIVGFITGRELM